MHDHAAQRAAHDGDEPFGLEDPERLAERGSRHAEALDQVGLVAQRVALGQLATDDQRAQLVRDQLGLLPGRTTLVPRFWHGMSDLDGRWVRERAGPLLLGPRYLMADLGSDSRAGRPRAASGPLRGQVAGRPEESTGRVPRKAVMSKSDMRYCHADARLLATRLVTVGAHPVRDGLNLLDGSWYAADPHEVWTWMRREAPVYYDETSDVWGISRYDDVLAIEKDPATFSSRRAPRPHGNPLPMMIAMDNPEHQRRRSLVSRGFTPKRVADHEATVERICTTILDAVCERGECDFVWDVAAPLPLLLIADLLGFEQELHDDLLRWSDDLIRATTLDLTPEVAEAGLQRHARVPRVPAAR